MLIILLSLIIRLKHVQIIWSSSLRKAIVIAWILLHILLHWLHILHLPPNHWSLINLLLITGNLAIYLTNVLLLMLLLVLLFLRSSWLFFLLWSFKFSFFLGNFFSVFFIGCVLVGFEFFLLFFLWLFLVCGMGTMGLGYLLGFASLVVSGVGMDLLLLVLLMVLLLVVLRVMNVLLMVAVAHAMSLLMLFFSSFMNSLMSFADAVPAMMLLNWSFIRFFQFLLFFLLVLILLLLFVMISTHMTRIWNRSFFMNRSSVHGFMMMLGFWMRCSNSLSNMVLHVTLMRVFMTLLQTLSVAVATVLLVGKRMVRVRRSVLFVWMALVVMFVVRMMMLFLMAHLFSYFFNFLLDFLVICVQILKGQWNVLLEVFVKSLFFKIGFLFDSEFWI